MKYKYIRETSFHLFFDSKEIKKHIVNLNIS